MFMLKFATTQLDSTPFGFLFKVDDDTFVNVKALVKYTTVMARYTIGNWLIFAAKIFLNGGGAA